MTALFALAVIVSLVSLVRLLTRPFSGRSLGLLEWVLELIAVVGAAVALWRSACQVEAMIRRLRDGEATRPGGSAPSPARSKLWERLPDPVDDATWALVSGAVLGIDTLALTAIVDAIGDRTDGRGPAIGWFVWELALLLTCVLTVTRLLVALWPQLRDRALRRRRNVIHVIASKLSGAGSGARGDARRGAAAAVAVALLLAGGACATGFGPLVTAHHAAGGAGGPTTSSRPDRRPPAGVLAPAPGNGTSSRRSAHSRGGARRHPGAGPAGSATSPSAHRSRRRRPRHGATGSPAHHVPAISRTSGPTTHARNQGRARRTRRGKHRSRHRHRHQRTTTTPTGTTSTPMPTIPTTTPTTPTPTPTTPTTTGPARTSPATTP